MLKTRKGIVLRVDTSKFLIRNKYALLIIEDLNFSGLNFEYGYEQFFYDLLLTSDRNELIERLDRSKIKSQINDTNHISLKTH